MRIKNIKKVGMITGFSIILASSIFVFNESRNIADVSNEKVVYSDISEQVKGVQHEKKQKEVKKKKPSKNEKGAYNVSGTLIVNKKYGLDEDYTYEDNQELYDEATAAFEKMQQDAEKDGVWFHIVSRYRSYAVQNWVYENYKKDREDVDTFSAQPGHSEHQTGLAFDLNGEDQETSSNEKFEGTEQYKWLRKNAYKYGFILRYPKDKKDITGYKFEPWHYRYVGTDISYDLKDGETTLEEYFNLE
ncbi:M15 family metallopeptidase [Intestinibacter bartlettii]|uniref:M15 family metallopeptidase n=2 Tax=Intestinibacter bartlettii TaxID=261299 RepID=A0ABS6DWJ8_9FIRM|nr:M15 family metallopeptidase [Intestinibacter bartlettii]MBU5336221.1 M15 family metallopeptidase [Intestinibacter bartlettii]